MPNYYGTWASNVYTFGTVYGKVKADVDPTFSSATFTLSYDGFYRHGDSVKFDVTIDANNSVQTSQRVYTFKGSSQNQSIEFKATEMNQEKISGTYKTINPTDEGTFSLVSNSVPVPNRSGCILL
jgi:hypothetical protein